METLANKHEDSVQNITTNLMLEKNTRAPSKYLKCVHLYRKAPTCRVDRFQSDLSVVLGHHGGLKSMLSAGACNQNM